ncbi:MAG TPA: tRNA-dihydrouridine synthase family protein [Oceanipulchritudo sp.]|nr:tRNA-dihydrouridine synthase family protein [Oceanipulchritudo sp.]
MQHPLPFPEPLEAGSLPTALAPMQDVTDLAFMRLLGKYGVPDTFFTEYFRVHEHSTLEQPIVDSILFHETGRPVFAQMIGENLSHLRRTTLALQELPVAGIDLNMGCPAPKVYRKNVGGGLLREPAKVDQIFATLREACEGRFTVKMRLGFEDDRHFEEILRLVSKHGVDALSVHGRTVKQMYRGEVDYERIRMASESVSCPVFANGNITSAQKALEVCSLTGCYGAMVGRSAIRNPWIFRQIRELSLGQEPFRPLLGNVRHYIDDLWEAITTPGLPDIHRLNRMKKFLNFVGQGVDPEGRFLHEMRRTREAGTFFAICDTYLVEGGRDAMPFADEPYVGLVARPNAE